MLKFLCTALFVALLSGVIAHPEEDGGAFEGDMILSPEQYEALEEQRNKKNSFASIRSGLWMTNGKADKIKYYITREVAGASKVIALAIADYEKFTCLRFEKMSSRPSGPHLQFVTGSGCTSPVGRRYSGNRITLARGCWTKAIVIHEIGHSIGLFHEQSRPDRDNYVTIKLSNIQDRYRFAFDKYTTSRIDSRGTPYDYDSIMHYGSYYFSKNRQITIETKDPKDQSRIGQRIGFSEIDKSQINKMYCGNSGGGGGVTHPPPTNAPICKDDWDKCSERSKGCKDWGIPWINFMKKNCRKTCKFC